MSSQIKVFIFLLFLFATNIILAQDTPGFTFGGEKNDAGFDIIQSTDEGYLICGSTRSFGEGSSDIITIKLDKTGNIEWMKTYGWPHYDDMKGIIEVDDGYLLIGDAWDYGLSRLDMYLIKINLQGDIVWDKMYGTVSKDIGFKLFELPQKDLILLGYTRGEDYAGDIFILRTDPEGNEIWRNTYGTVYDDYGLDIVLNEEDDTFLVIGTESGFYNDVYATYFRNHDADEMLLCIDFDGNEVWRKTYGGSGHDFGGSILKIDEDIFICGSTQSYGNGSFDMFLQKTDLEGNEEWFETFGGIDYEYGSSMAQSADEGIYIFGTTKSFGQNGSADFYLIKSDYWGNELWNLTIGGDLIEKGYSVVATADSGAAVIGKSNSFGNGEYDILFVKVDKNGIIEDFVNGIDSIYKGDFLVYPNPVGEFGHIKTLQTVPRKELFMELISISGQNASAFTISLPDYRFSTQSLPSGTYIYQIRQKQGSDIIYSGKLIVR